VLACTCAKLQHCRLPVQTQLHRTTTSAMSLVCKAVSTIAIMGANLVSKTGLPDGPYSRKLKHIKQRGSQLCSRLICFAFHAGHS
jgi:hypothetical protein